MNVAGIQTAPMSRPGVTPIVADLANSAGYRLKLAGERLQAAADSTSSWPSNVDGLANAGAHATVAISFLGSAEDFVKAAADSVPEENEWTYADIDSIRDAVESARQAATSGVRNLIHAQPGQAQSDFGSAASQATQAARHLRTAIDAA